MHKTSLSLQYKYFVASSEYTYSRPTLLKPIMAQPVSTFSCLFAKTPQGSTRSQGYQHTTANYLTPSQTLYSVWKPTVQCVQHYSCKLHVHIIPLPHQTVILQLINKHSVRVRLKHHHNKTQTQNAQISPLQCLKANLAPLLRSWVLYSMCWFGQQWHSSLQDLLCKKSKTTNRQSITYTSVLTSVVFQFLPLGHRFLKKLQSNMHTVTGQYSIKLNNIIQTSQSTLACLVQLV